MTDHTDRSNNPFAGEKKPSMLRRCSGNDYRARRMYMITMTTANRTPWFGQIVGSTNAPWGSEDFPHIALSPIGRAVGHCWFDIHTHHPEIEVVMLQMMPDHLHGILFVKEELTRPLGKVINGFKAGCNKAFRKLILHEEQPTFNKSLTPKQYGRSLLLWAKGYNDRILYQDGQYERWKKYLYTNPYRLLMKREHPELFKVQRDLRYGNLSFSAVGNRFLLDYPEKIALRCSRSMTTEDIEKKKQKTIMRALVDGSFPVVFLQENGLTSLAKPGGTRFALCAAGKLLILAPWEHHNERRDITHSQCLELNDMAQMLARL